MLLAHLDAAGTELNQNLVLLQALGLRGRVHGAVTITGTEPGEGVPAPVIDLGSTLTSSAYAIDPTRTSAAGWTRAHAGSVRQDFEVFLPRSRRTDHQRIASGTEVHPRVDQDALDEELGNSDPHAHVAQRMAEAYSRLSRLIAAHRTSASTPSGAQSDLTQVLVESADEILDVLDLARTHAAAGVDDRFVHRTHALSTRLLAVTSNP
jgi:hypothetical protein